MKNIAERCVVYLAGLVCVAAVIAFVASKARGDTPTPTATPTQTHTVTPSPTHCKTWQVNSTLDTGDETPDGTCDDGSGNCTLREAIQEVNADSCAGKITFSISGDGPHTISVAGDPNNLPTLTKAHAVIDCLSEPGSSAGTGWWTESYSEPTPMIVIDKETSGQGLVIDAPGVIVQGCKFISSNNSASGIQFTANADFSQVRACVVEGVYGGIATDGLGAGGIIIGGQNSGDGNVIRDVMSNTIIVGIATDSAFDHGILIAGNEVDEGDAPEGQSATGIVAYGQDGVRIDRNWIHGCRPTVGVCNGINIPSSVNALVTRNYSGVNRDGTAADGNQNGIHTSTSDNDVCANHVIGGSAPNRNIFAGNTLAGVHVEAGCSGVSISHNYIGVGADGETPICNTQDQIKNEGTSTTTASNTLCVPTPTPTIPPACCQVADATEAFGHPGSSCLDNTMLGGQTIAAFGGCAVIAGFLSTTVETDGAAFGMNCHPTPGGIAGQCVTPTPAGPAGPTETPTATPTPRPDTVGRLWFREACPAPPCDSARLAWRGRKTITVDVPVGTASVDALCRVGHSTPITLATLTGTSCDTPANCQAEVTAACDELYLEVTECTGCLVSGSVRQH